MMRMVKRIMCLVATLTVAMSLVACGGNNELVGTWELVQEIPGGSLRTSYTFDSNGDVTQIIGETTVEGTYEIDDDIVIITMELSDGEVVNSYRYDVDGESLTMQRPDGNSLVNTFTRK